MNKKWYLSKTKLGSLLLGGGTALSALGAYVLGQTDAATMVKGIATGIGIILFGFGLRNALE